ncbi:hypothetical protein ACFX2H_011282 [Malus domestica]
MEELRLLNEDAYDWRCIAQWSGGTKFQVDIRGGDQFIVDLTERICSCWGFNLTGIPCNHAIVAINYRQDKPEDYLDGCYSKASSSAHEASSNPGGVPRKRGRKPKASSTAGGGNSEVQTDGGV